MIVILDCYYKLSKAMLLAEGASRRSKVIDFIEPANKVYLLARKICYCFFRVQLIKAAIIQTMLTMMKIDHILFISF